MNARQNQRLASQKQSRRRSFLETRRAHGLGKRTLRFESLEDRKLLATFQNTNAITINDFTTASPYPSTINVSLPAGVSAQALDVNARLVGLSHSFSNDVAVLLQSPASGAVELMRNVGDNTGIVNANLTFSDGAPALPFFGAPASGAYAPTVFSPIVAYPAPAPAGPYGAALNALGVNPVGNWNLYVFDDTVADVGVIAGGWALDIQFGGNVTITGTAGNDTINVARSGSNLVITLNGNPVFNELASGVTSLTVDGLAGNDSLTVDYTGGNPIPTGGVTFNGGGQSSSPGDTLRIFGGAFTTITKNFTNSSDGSVNLDGAVVNYTGLEPVLLNVGSVANAIFNLPNVNDIAVLEDDGGAGNGTSRLRSGAGAPTFETTDFTNPTTSLTINAGSSDDQFSFDAADSLFNANVVYNSDAGGGDVFLNATTGSTNSYALNGGAGNESFFIFGNADNLNTITRPVSVTGGGGGDTLTISDLSGAVADPLITITNNLVSGIAPAAISYTGITTLEVDPTDNFAVTLQITSLLASTSLIIIDTSNQSDTITIGNGTLDNVLGAVEIDDYVAGADTLIYNDAADTDNNTYTLSSDGDLTRTGIAGVTVVTTAAPDRFETVTLNTGTGSDTINVAPPVSGIVVNINGNNPVAPASPGDVLNYQGNATKTIVGPGAGTLTQAGVGPVSFTGIETVSATGGSLTDQFTFPTNGTPNSLRLVRSGANIQFFFDDNTGDVAPEVLLLQQLYSGTASPITITGSGDDDTLIIDQAGGLIDRAVNFAGNGQNNATFGDELRLTNGSVNTVTYNHTDANSGTVNVDGTIYTYSGLEPIFDNMNAVNRVMNFNNNAQTITIQDDISQPGGPFAGMSQAASPGQAEIVFFTTPTGSLTVNGGTGGDTIRVFPTIDPLFNTPTVNINSGTGIDEVRVLRTAAGTITNVDTQNNANDRTVVGADSFPGNGGTGAGTLNNILGVVNVADTGGGAELFVDASGDAAGTYNFTATQISRGAVVVNYTAGLDPVHLATGGQNDMVNVTGTSAAVNTVFTNAGNDEIRVTGVAAGDNLHIEMGAGLFDRTVIGAASFAAFNTGAGSLANIQGVVNVNHNPSFVGETYIDNSGDGVNGRVFNFNNSAAIPFFGTEGITLTSPLFPAGAINVANNSSDNYQFADGSGDSTLNIFATADSGIADSLFLGNPGADTFNILGDGLGDGNIFRGENGVDQFVLQINTNLGALAANGLDNVTIDGGNAVSNSLLRDRLTINDNNAGFGRDLNYDYTNTPGGLDIAPSLFAPLSGLAGAVQAGLPLQTLGLETIIFNAPGGNDDAVQVTGTSGDDILSVGLLASTTAATVFLGGTPYLGTPPETLAGSRPGVAGGGTGPDLLINGITALSGVRLFGGGNTGTVGQGDQAVVYASSENGLNTGGGEDIFNPNGFAPGELIPGFGIGNSFDFIGVNGPVIGTTATPAGATDVRVFSGYFTELMPVFVDDASFIQAGPATPQQQAAIIVNAGDEPSFAAPQVFADLINVIVSTNFNLRVNGNLPPLNLGPNGLPVGDQLNIGGPGDVNIFSDKAAPPNVSVTFSLNPAPFGVQHSSIERLQLSPTTGVVNLIGDNNDPLVDQTDNFVVVGRDIDAPFPLMPIDAGFQEMTVSINGSAPILLDNVERLNVFGDDQNPPPGTPSAGNDTDTLDIRPYADDTPRGWGVATVFDEGNPQQAGEGMQADLLIIRTSLFGGPVSENIVVQPSGPENGEVIVTNRSFGTPIATVDFTTNTDIIVLDDDGFLSDTDTLTLRGTNPDPLQTSGNETFLINLNATQTAGDPLVSVTDTDNGLILYQLRGFIPEMGLPIPAPINTITFDGLAGNDTFNVLGPSGLLAPLFVNTQANFLGGEGTDNLNIDLLNGAKVDGAGIFYDGGSGEDALAVFNSGAVAIAPALTTTIYTPGADVGDGRLTYQDGLFPDMVIDFANLEPVVDTIVSANLIVNANNASNAINYGPGANPANGLVSIDNHETIEFANKTVLTINALAGDDVINLNNPVPPNLLGVGLGVGVPAIVVNGGDPTASDRLIVNSGPGFDPLVVVPTAQGAGAVNSFVGNPGVGYRGIEQITLVGQLVDADPFGVDGTAGNDVFQYTSGATPDTGTIRGTLNGGLFTLPEITFQGIAQGAAIVLNQFGVQGGTDTVVLNGTSSNDVITYAGGGLLTNTVNGQLFANIFVGSPNFSAGTTTAVVIDAFDGDDVITVTSEPGVPINVNGGNPSSGSDVLNFLGSGAAGGVVTVDYGLATVTETGNAPVAYTGIEVINAFDGGQNGVVTATAGDDVLDVTPTAAGAATFRLTSANPSIGGAPVVNFAVGGTLTADGGLGTNALTFNGTAGVDAFTITRSVGALSLQNGVTQQILASNTFASWTVKGGDSNDAFTINETAGAGVISPIELNLEGGAGTNSLTYNSGVNQTYVPAGGLAGSFTGAAAATNYTNLATATVTLAGAATTGTVQASGAANQITVNGTAAATITAVVDGGTLVTYTGTVTTLNVNAGAGDDEVSVTPGLFAGAGGINVAGNDPTASDRVVVTGTAGLDNVTVATLSPSSATVTGAGAAVVTVATTEGLVYSGQGGNDNLTYQTPAGADAIVYTPGAAPDAGTITAANLFVGGLLLGMQFANLGAFGTVNFTDAAAPVGGVDGLEIRGTENADAFFLGVAPNTVQVFDATIFAFSRTLPILTPGVAALELHGLDGDDAFFVPGNHGYAILAVQGGNPSGGSDVLNFAGTGGAVVADYGLTTITEGVNGRVAFTGIEIINANTAGGNLTVNDTAGDDVFDVTPTGLNAVTTRVTSTTPVVTNTPVLNGVAIGAYLLNAITGDDRLKVRYTSNPETIDVNGTAGTVNVTAPAGTLEQITFTAGAGGLDALEVYGNEGSDTFNVTPSATLPIFIDGGDPIGITGDTIIINGGVTLFKPGPEVDEGGFQVGGNELISFDHIEAAIVLGAPCAIVTGTNADDDITVIARGANFNALADGVQDFTVSVNAGLEVLYIGTAMLGIDALAGDDDIVIRTPDTNAVGLPGDALWNVQVSVVGGSPSIGDPSEADRLVLETPFADNITYTPTGPDTATIGINAGNTGGLITILSALPAGFCPGINYSSSVGGVEVIQYDGELGGAFGGTGAVVDTITINGSAAADTTTINAGGIGSGAFRSSLSPLFDFRSFTTVTVNGGAGGADLVIINGTEGPDTFTSPVNNQVALTGGVAVNLTANGSLDRMELFTFGGNDNVTLTLLEATLAKVVDAGAGNDTINMLASADGTFIGGIGDDNITGTPAADLIFGGSGNDILIGAGGIDTIYGEDGNDVFGNPGATQALALLPNSVADDAGNDLLFGGDGSDTFVWEPGDGSDVIEGGSNESDVMLFFGNGNPNTFVLSAVATRLQLNFGGGAVLMSAAGVEEVDVRGLAGSDTFTVSDLFPTDVRTVTLDLGVEAGVFDGVSVLGRNVSDNVNIAQTTATRVSVTGLRYDVRIDNATMNDLDALNFEGNDGNDTIVAQDALTATFGAAFLFINGGAGDDFISGHGTLLGGAGNDTLIGGSADQTISGGAGNDQIFGEGGDDTLNGNAGEDTFVGGLGNDTIDGGGDWDTILVQATGANDRIDVRQNHVGAVIAGVTQLLYEISNQFTPGVDGLVGGLGTETDNLVAGAAATVEEVRVVAGSGDDQIRATHSDQLIALGQQIFSVRMTIDGGAPGASDRLTVQDDGLGDTTIHRIGGAAGSGSFQVGALAPVVYVDVEYASLNPVNAITGATGTDSAGRLIVFPYDANEQNQTLTNATFLGNGTADLTGTIDPGVDPAAGGFGIAGDEDWFRVVAPVTGVLDFQVYFRELSGLIDPATGLPTGRAGLPGNGNLDIGVYDADGLVNGAALAIGGFGTFGTNDGGAELDTAPLANERVRIPAVAGQTYYVRIGGAAMLQNGTPNTSAALNVYNLSVVSSAAPVARDLELDDVIAQSTVSAAPAPTATTFTAPAAGLSTTPSFYVNKFVYFIPNPALPSSPSPLNGQRGLVTGYDGAGGFTFAPGTFTVAPAVGDFFQIESVDTGRSQLDNVTRDNTPTIFLRLDDAGLLNDLPGNPVVQTNAPPPDQVIPITYQLNGALPATAGNQVAAGGYNPGFRIAIFDETDTHNPVTLGYASPVGGAPGVYTFTFSNLAPLTDGSHFITAKVEMIDPADTTTAAGIVRASGYGVASQSLEIVVDTGTPPVAFGQPPSNQAGREFTLTDGLHPDSDTGVAGMPASFNDRITSDLTPRVYGTAEANSIVRVYIDNLAAGTVGLFDALDVLAAQTVATPTDGTNQLPTGRWDTELTVSLNDQRFFPAKDGMRTLFVTAEDASGNVRPADPLQIERLNIFVDTQGPQVTDVRFNTVTSTYNIFDHKNEGLPQGPGEPGTLVPTPLVNSIIVKLQDLPTRQANFFYQAIKTNLQLINQTNGAVQNTGVDVLPLGLVTLKGDAEGIIPIRRVTFTADQNVNTPAIDAFAGADIARGYLTITFGSDPDGIAGNADDIAISLPDDRFTLTISDSLQDPVGNQLDGEAQTSEPHDQPRFPSGDGIPGAAFSARFTVDTRPEVGTWAAGSVYLDINGNEIWDPTNPDFTNRDFSFIFGVTADDLIAGNFAADGAAAADGFDKIAAYGRFNGTFRWLIDTDNDGVPNIRRTDPANFNGLPAAGDFSAARPGDEVAVFNGSTWMLDTTGDFRLDTTVNWPGPAGGYPVVGDFDNDGLDDLGAWNDDFFRIDLANNGFGQIDVAPFRFGFIGVGERPVAADMNMDGFDDLGLWVPSRAGVLPKEAGEFFILVSGQVPNDDFPGSGPATLGPSIINRIVTDSISGERVVRFQPVPFGHDVHIQFGDDFALPLLGNFDPPAVISDDLLVKNTNTRDPLDVNNDGYVTGLDAVIIVEYLNGDEPALLPISEFPQAPFRDVNGDGYVTGLDAVLVVQRLNEPDYNGGGGEGEFFSLADGDDELDGIIDLLVGDDGPRD